MDLPTEKLLKQMDSDSENDSTGAEEEINENTNEEESLNKNPEENDTFNKFKHVTFSN